MPRAASKSKRKTSSSSRKSSSLATKVMLWVGGSLVLLLLLTSLFAYARARSWIKGPEFRDLVEQKVGEAAHADAELKPLEWDGWDAYSEGMTLLGHPQAGFRRIDLNGVRVSARPTGVWRGAWELPQVKLDEATLSYRIDDTGMPREVPPSGETSQRGDTEKDKPSGLAGMLPQRVELGAVDVASLNISPAEGAGFTARDLRLQVEQDSAGNRFVATAEGGTVSIPVLPEFQLRTLDARISSESINLMGGRLHRSGRGQLEIGGRIGLAESMPTDLRIRVLQLPLDTIIASDWKQRIEGEAQADLSWRGDGQRSWLDGKLSILGARLTLLPVLDRLARYFDDARLRQINFDEASCHLFWEDGQVEITKIFLHSRGLMRLEGELSVHGNQIEGQLHFGVVPSLLSSLPRAEQEVFAESRDGLRWTPIQIGGTLDDIEEDLSGRIMVAAAQRMLDWLPEPLRAQATAGGEILVGELPLLGAGASEENGRARSTGSLLETGMELGTGVIDAGGELIRDPAGAINRVRESAGDLLEGGGGALLDRGGDAVEAGAGLLGNLLGGNQNEESNKDKAKEDPEQGESTMEPEEHESTNRQVDPDLPPEQEIPSPDQAPMPEEVPQSGQIDVPDDADSDDLFGY